MTPIVFAGPSLHCIPAEHFTGLTLRPPAAAGDVLRAASEGAAAIGLIDGLFETTASIWHKELLWALLRGVAIYGSSSMGALRAAEMAPFGMRGVGLVYRLYRSGAIIDDDEVAQQHGPPETGSIPVTEAMVNIRATLRRARRAETISVAGEREIATVAKSLFYKLRSYDHILDIAERRPNIGADARRLRLALEHHRRDVKREDALRLLSKLRAPPPSLEAAPPRDFPRTLFWDAFEREHLRSRTDLNPASPALRR